MKKKQDYKKYWWGLALIAITAPFVLNFVLSIPKLTIIVGDATTWLSFWPIYLSVIATFIVICITLQNNKDIKQQQLKMMQQNETLHQKQKKLLIRTNQYTQEQEKLQNIRRQLDANYRLFDFQSISISINYIETNNFTIANNLLLELSRRIEEQALTSALYINGDCVISKKYNEYFSSLLMDYRCILNDLLLLLPIKIGRYENTMPTCNEINKYLDTQKRQREQQLGSTNPEISFLKYEQANSILKNLQFPYDSDIDYTISSEIKKIYEKLARTQTKKNELKERTMDLLTYYENMTNEILSIN